MEKYVLKNGKRLRYGYTTGSCAAAASKAAAIMLKNKEKIDEVEIDTPKGWKLRIKVYNPEIKNKKTSCSVVKDAGDDPDITNGLKIFAEVSPSDGKELEIIGGIGVGKITRNGLSLPAGEWAINPTPRKMIMKEFRKIFPKGGYRIKFWIPKGEEVAKKTFNPKLGIKGGISIIGTSGIVEPMSEKALIESIKIELKMAVESGRKKLVFTFGNYGRDYSLSKGIDDDCIIKTSNYLGEILQQASDMKVERVLLVGHIGKLIKVAGGIFNTHSRYADARMEITAAYASLFGGRRKTTERILKCITTEEAIGVIKEDENIDFKGLFEYISEKAKQRCLQHIYEEIKIETVVFSQKYGLLGLSSGVEEIMEKYNE